MGQTTEELNSDIAERRRALAEDLDALQDKVSPSAIAQRKKQAMTSRARGVRSKIMGTTQAATQGGSNAMASATDAVSDTAGDVAQTAQEQYDGSPLAAGLVAFGVGLVAAGLMPPSDAETQVAGKVVDAAKEQTGPLQDTLKSEGQQIAAQLKDEATSAAAQVRDSAQESVAHVKDETGDAADKVRSDATG